MAQEEDTAESNFAVSWELRVQGRVEYSERDGIVVHQRPSESLADVIVSMEQMATKSNTQLTHALAKYAHLEPTKPRRKRKEIKVGTCEDGTATSTDGTDDMKVVDDSDDDDEEEDDDDDDDDPLDLIIGPSAPQ